MATYLYCVRSDPVPPSAWLVGIDGGPVRAVEADDLLAWVSDVGPPTIEADVARLKAHDAVCSAALESGDTPLPVRFGQVFPDDAATVAGIAARSSELRVRLTRIAGCVELRVVITRAADGSEAAGASSAGTDAGELEGPGTAFLMRLARAGRAELAREVGCEEVRHEIRGAAGTLIVDQLRCETARGLAYFPVLVRRDDVTAFREVVTTTLSSQTIDLSVFGPFAPYSFAGDA
jgi:hypothetical protein